MFSTLEMESNKSIVDNSTFSGSLNNATDATPSNVPGDGSMTEGIVGIWELLISQIEEREQAYQELEHRYDVLFSANGASGERMEDVVIPPTETSIPEGEGDWNEDEDDGQNLNRENTRYEVLFEHHKRINVGLRVRVFYLSVKLHKYESPKSTCLENKELCSICLEDYCNMDKLAEIDCGHLYHVDCIKKWIKLKNSCPICKRDALAILT